MRVQRSIISQSIQKDERSGKSIVDNESILLAATVIATKVYLVWCMRIFLYCLHFLNLYFLLIYFFVRQQQLLH